MESNPHGEPRDAQAGQRGLRAGRRVAGFSRLRASQSDAVGARSVRCVDGSLRALLPGLLPVQSRYVALLHRTRLRRGEGQRNGPHGAGRRRDAQLPAASNPHLRVLRGHRRARKSRVGVSPPRQRLQNRHSMDHVPAIRASPRRNPSRTRCVRACPTLLQRPFSLHRSRFLFNPLSHTQLASKRT